MSLADLPPGVVGLSDDGKRWIRECAGCGRFDDGPRVNEVMATPGPLPDGARTYYWHPECLAAHEAASKSGA